MNRLPPPDEIAHQDGVLMAEVSQVNSLLGRYVLDFLDADADAGRRMPVSPAVERALAVRVAALASRLGLRAERREQQGDPQPLVGSVLDENRS